MLNREEKGLFLAVVLAAVGIGVAVVAVVVVIAAAVAVEIVRGREVEWTAETDVGEEWNGRIGV